eukprot:TRINITY_DN7878_c0_g1_i1.p1 TRINITY_DN7878_c0_g1~~TRINITY_DN7878_c0_g1_i1.p1  ORF type:complete len:275 (-),score=42.30 TRINITY_DN7878_c0_g1_i1:908-1732(-)
MWYNMAAGCVSRVRRSKEAASLLAVAMELLDNLSHLEGRSSASASHLATLSACPAAISRRSTPSACSFDSAQSSDSTTASRAISKSSMDVDATCRRPGGPNVARMAEDVSRTACSRTVAGRDERGPDGSEGMCFFGGFAHVANSKTAEVPSSSTPLHWEGVPLANRPPTLLQSRRALPAKTCLSTTYGSQPRLEADGTASPVVADNKAWSCRSLYQEPEDHQVDATGCPSRIDIASLQCFADYSKFAAVYAEESGLVATKLHHAVIPKRVLMGA